MATAAKKEFGEGAGIEGEYKRPDAAKAFDIYDKQIKPKLTKIDTARGECSQPWQDIKEHANFPRPVMNFINMLDGIEDEAKRDHFLLALDAGLAHRKLFKPRDLVSMADGAEGGSIVPSEDRPRPKLVGVDDTNDFEASEEELAGQKPRADEAEAKAFKKASVDVNPNPGFVGEPDLPPAA